ncbi:unnamed protein product, partial [Durusdinium trenchii]
DSTKLAAHILDAGSLGQFLENEGVNEENRTKSIAKFAEASFYAYRNGSTELIQAFEKLTPTTDSFLASKWDTLRIGILLPGDCMITPPGFICVEKMLNAHSIGIKIVLPMVHASTLQSAEILNNTLPKPGCTDSWTILLW